MTGAVGRFHRLRFASLEAASTFFDRLMSAASSPRGREHADLGLRLVVFAALEPERRGVEYAYLSDGAMVLASVWDPSVTDGDEVTLENLPAGLIMLMGTAEDANAYTERADGPGDNTWAHTS